ncbi:hypothetical protein [Sphingomonas sp. GV3]|uniref:hypothetical protein n=1 Tax=Sphingomonas sp. GV3 TaxID=3040671 RepID=UPI00280B6822|nr:hypothetical protein [Sphingomonas sp. GV3]
MRWLGFGLACVLVAGCSKAPDAGPGDAATRATDVAFAYRYDFRLPSSRIAEAQEAHATACERLGPGRCRITGMSYHLDASGTASASLDLRVASPIARGFGQDGIKGIAAAGGALTSAEIVGTDAAPQRDAALTGAADAHADLGEVDRQLARADLSKQMRSDLLARRAALLETQRQAAAAGAAARASVMTTPISFRYDAGSGVGLVPRLLEAAQAGYASLTWTLATTLTLIAWLAPPSAMLLLLAWAWHRLGRRWWARVFPDVRSE